MLGLLGAETDNGVGVTGVTWYSKIYVYKVGSYDGIVEDAYVRDAIQHAVSNYGIKIFSCSFGRDSHSESLWQALIGDNGVESVGGILIAASGNIGASQCSYPAIWADSRPSVIAVAATDHLDYRLPYSNYGSSVTIAAPGGVNLATSPEDSVEALWTTGPGYAVSELWATNRMYRWANGTSSATALVSGLVSLIWSVNPGLSNVKIKALICENADHVHEEEVDPDTEIEYDYTTTGRNDIVGYGRINMERTLANIKVENARIEVVPLEESLARTVATDRPPPSCYIHLSWDTHRGDLFWRYRIDRSEETPDNWEWRAFIEQPEYDEAQMWDDYMVEDGVDYYYKISVADSDYQIQYLSSDILHAYFDGGFGQERMIPNDITLESNYPNPFNPVTQIRFCLPELSHVRLEVFNTRGQTIRTILDEDKPMGWHTVMWDGKDTNNQDVASGIYFYVLEAQGKRLLKKMVLVR
jgi:hypothetical protein